MQTFKQKIHTYYLQQAQDRIDAFRDMIAALTEDAANDAKGSAGDKHETALSMMHLEQEKLNAKLSECIAQKAILEKIDPAAQHVTAALGSVVKANAMWLFISAALPKISIEGQTVIALSPQSPLGERLLGNKEGSAFEIGTTKYIIHEIN